MTRFRSDSSSPWQLTALELTKAEEDGAWRPAGYSSYTQYVAAVAQKLGKTPPALWRLIRAVRAYKNLQAQFPGQPDFIDLPVDLAPESLSHLVQLSRVAPRDLIAQLLPQVVNGSMRRDQLKSILDVHLHQTNSTVPRGRRANAGLSPEVSDERKRLAAADAAAIIRAAETAATWLGVPPGTSDVRVFTDASISTNSVRRFRFDLIVAARNREAQSVEIHCVETKSGSAIQRFPERFAAIYAYSDYFWLLVIDPDGRNPVRLPASMPNVIGILLFVDGEITVQRRALPTGGEASGTLAKQLLLR